MKKLTALVASALLSLSAQTAVAGSTPSSEDALVGSGIPKVMFCNTRGTQYFSCDPVQQLPASFARTPAAALDEALTAADCSDRNDGSFYCRGNPLQSGVDSVWWRFKKNGMLTATYIYIYD